MSFKLNHKAIANYSERLTEQTLNRVFYSKDFLSGKDIASLTEVPQLNVLILKILFEKWNEEAQRLRSKYFDFAHPDVELALLAFKNKLSHHIKVDQDTFRGLLEEAVRDTLSLVFEPKRAIKELFLADVVKYKEQLKFLKLHEELIKALINISDASLEELHAVVDTWENYTTPQQLLEQTSSIQPGIVEDFIINEVDETPLISQANYQNSGSAEKKTMNDKFQKGEEPITLASQFQEKNKIESLQKGININDKFTFVKELFEGDTEAYNLTINQLDGMASYDQATSFLSDQVMEKYNWKDKNDIRITFLERVKKRYN